MYNVIFNSGFIGFLIWLLLFAVSTAALAIAIRCAWSLRASLFATREFKEKLLPLLRQGKWQGHLIFVKLIRHCGIPIPQRGIFFNKYK